MLLAEWRGNERLAAAERVLCLVDPPRRVRHAVEFRNRRGQKPGPSSSAVVIGLGLLVGGETSPDRGRHDATVAVGLVGVHLTARLSVRRPLWPHNLILLRGSWHKNRRRRQNQRSSPASHSEAKANRRREGERLAGRWGRRAVTIKSKQGEEGGRISGLSNELRQIEWVNLNLSEAPTNRDRCVAAAMVAEEEGKSKHPVSFQDLGGHSEHRTAIGIFQSEHGGNKSESDDTRALHWAFHDAERGRGALATLVISSGRGL